MYASSPPGRIAAMVRADVEQPLSSHAATCFGDRGADLRILAVAAPGPQASSRS